MDLAVVDTNKGGVIVRLGGASWFRPRFSTDAELETLPRYRQP